MFGCVQAEKRLKATVLRASTCSLSLFFPTLHHSPVCLLCRLWSNSVFCQCWRCQAHGLSLPASAGPWPLLHCLFYGCRDVTLCAPLLCIFILTLHTWSADSSTSALVLTWSCCCCQFPCSSTVWSSPHPSSNRHVSFTISHSSCQSLLLLWLEAVDAAADRVAYLMVSQSEVALTSQACNEVRSWLQPAMCAAPNFSLQGFQAAIPLQVLN